MKIVCAIFAVLFCALAAPSSDKITYLPGFDVNSLGFAQYSGYITVSETHGRRLFYWFVESANEPSTDPVIIWLNGGPGCSSLDGLFSEHGPLHFDNDGNLYSNPYSWNKIANIIYLESPSGVGFSYSADNSTVLTDKETAANSYQFLLNFFSEYPEFSSNDFYVSGESYGGHYVPQLAYQIWLGNQKGNKKINLKGVMVGNGVTDNYIDGNSYLPYNHAFVSETQYDDAQVSCGGNYVNNTSSACQEALNVINFNMDNINPYNIYDTCVTTDDTRPHPLNHIFTRQLRDQIPCVNSTVETNYLNDDDVKTAIHAESDIEWTVCNLVLNSEYVRDNSVLYLYPIFLKNNIRVLIYSGDVDSSVNYKGSQRWVHSLNLQVVKDWASWNVDGQVAGFIKEFQGLTFLTVKGAGHMVPQYKPHQAYVFYQKWLTKSQF